MEIEGERKERCLGWDKERLEKEGENGKKGGMRENEKKGMCDY